MSSVLLMKIPVSAVHMHMCIRVCMCLFVLSQVLTKLSRMALTWDLPTSASFVAEIIDLPPGPAPGSVLKGTLLLTGRIGTQLRN